MGKTALERMQETRANTGNAYGKARGAAEREVVEIVKKSYPTVYETFKRAVDSEFADRTPPFRQVRLRSDLATWFREQHCKRWEKLLDKHVAECGVVVVRRKKC